MGKHLIKQNKRKCYRCKQVLPLSIKFFRTHRKIAGGLNDMCYKCEDKEIKKWKKEYSKRKRRWSYKHLCLVKIAEKKLGRELKPGEVIHRIDGNRENNSPENLYIFRNQSAHANYESNLKETYIKWIRAEINKGRGNLPEK